MQCCEDQSERILRLIPSVFICIAVELLRNQAYLYQCLEQLGVSSIVRTLKALRLQITWKSVAIPFLDYLISDISSRFSTHSKQAASLQGLLPVNTTVNTSIVDLNEAIVFHSDDLPNPNILDEELCRWKTQWLAVKLQDRPEAISDTLKQCCLTWLPNMFYITQAFWNNSIKLMLMWKIGVCTQET